jgi:uncharacterized OB-fold protein/acyl dehydratase
VSETFADHSAELAALVGQPAGPPDVSPHAVNEPMIRHWVEAMGDLNPVYVSADAAQAAGLDSVIAPPTMLQAWVMRGLRATLAVEEARAGSRPRGDSATDTMMALLDAEGMTSVVATNCDQTYGRPLVVGDRLIVSAVIDAISDIKKTALGPGRFVTTLLEFRAVPDEAVTTAALPTDLVAAGELVATMRFRILKFRPISTRPVQDATGSDGARPLRPRPVMTRDVEFWFEGVKEGKLLIQRCVNCGRLRHPPLPACAACRSFEWDTIESSGRGELFSFVIVHHPKVPGFDYPLAIGLIELEEGTRLVANVDGIEPERLTVGMAVEVHYVAHDDGLVLPAFGPARPATEDT